MVAVTEPETVIRLDTPAGLVEVRVAVSEGAATAVTLRNVPAFLERRDAIVELPDGVRSSTTSRSAATSTRSSTPRRSSSRSTPSARRS